MLASGIYKNFEKPFVVDEDSLRRIQATLEKNAKNLSEETQVVFHVEREDDRFYETTDITDILSDPNINKKKIILVSIELRRKNDENLPAYKSNWIVMVYFSHLLYSGKDKAVVQISSSDKNWALLLADELEPQVIRNFRAKSIPRWLIGLLLSAIFILTTQLFSSSPLFTSSGLNTSAIFRLLFILGGGLAFAYWIELFPKKVKSNLHKVVGPESGFIWGEQGEAYSEREKMRQNLYWGVIIAFIVSILASFVYSWLAGMP